MGEVFEKLFASVGVAALREFGWWSIVILALAIIALGLLLAAAERLMKSRAKIRAWLFPGERVGAIVKAIGVGFLVLVCAAFLFIPSSPIIAVGFPLGVAALAIKYFRKGTSTPQVHYAVMLGTLLCLGLTIGGILHDIAMPPTARCSDGTYSSSANHRGTCSWHGGVEQWGPDPWWESIFE
jgi:hypothetical protein